MFSRYRAPDIVVSDNGPQFASAEFTKFTISTPPTQASEEAPADPVSDDRSTPLQTSKAPNRPPRRSQRARRQPDWFMDCVPS